MEDREVFAPAAETRRRPGHKRYPWGTVRHFRIVGLRWIEIRVEEPAEPAADDPDCATVPCQLDVAVEMHGGQNIE